MAKQTITVRRRHTVEREETVEVEFPVFLKGTDDNYAGSIPYESTATLTRIEESGRVTTATRTRETCGGNGDFTLKWEIETEIVDHADLAQHLDGPNWGMRCEASAEAFWAHLAEARAWMGI